MAIVLAALPLLSACSGRDTDTAEKVAAAQQAATRAEQAAERAEQAAAKLNAGQPTVVDAEPEPDPEPQDPAAGDQDDQPKSEANPG
ncbi:MAG: hypothetical protein C0515_00215 [Novosphingobium sp.]|nr:hypothetical protein [Novosphingobium sp.]